MFCGIVPLGLILIALSGSHASGIPKELLFERYTLSKSVCADKSPAIYFWRNCSANWDRHPGDPNFCAPPSNAINRTIVIFEPSSSFSYSATSLAYWKENEPNRTSSLPYPATLFPGGILSPFAEVNPNLYKSRAIFVPYCSADMWVGQNNNFQGRLIAQEVMDSLHSYLESGNATTIVVGPGLLEWANTYKSKLPNVTIVCDGCLLLDGPIYNSSKASCTTPYNCPLSKALELAQPLWNNGNLSRFLPPSILTHANNTLLTQQQWDSLALQRLGAPASDPSSSSWLTLKKYLQTQALSYLSANPTLYAFSPACSSPSTLTLSDEAYYHLLVSHTTPSYNHTLLDSLSQALPAFLTTKNITTWGTFIDPNFTNPTNCSVSNS